MDEPFCNVPGIAAVPRRKGKTRQPRVLRTPRVLDASYLALFTFRNPWVLWIMRHDPAILAGTPQDPSTGEAIGPVLPRTAPGRVVRCRGQRRLRGRAGGQLALDLI